MKAAYNSQGRIADRKEDANGKIVIASRHRLRFCQLCVLHGE
jgi:hypothetical protein